MVGGSTCEVLYSSFLGDQFRGLFDVYKRESARAVEVAAPLAAWVDQVLCQAGFAPGSQQDAAEFLMHVLLSMDHGNMQRRVCGANAAASVESMILCEIADEAQVQDATINFAQVPKVRPAAFPLPMA